VSLRECVSPTSRARPCAKRTDNPQSLGVLGVVLIHGPCQLLTIELMERHMAGEPITALTPAPTQTITAPTSLNVGFHVQPQFDVIELLPEGAPQDRLRKLRLRSADAHRLKVVIRGHPRSQHGADRSRKCTEEVDRSPAGFRFQPQAG
jgi:hypothetical protein